MTAAKTVLSCIFIRHAWELFEQCCLVVGGCFLFDFPTKGILAEAVRHSQYWRLIDHEGRMPGLAGYWPSRSVTFIDNHDTGKHCLTFTGCYAMGCCTCTAAHCSELLTACIASIPCATQLHCAHSHCLLCCNDHPCFCRQDWPCLCLCPCLLMFRAFALDYRTPDRSSGHASKGKHGLAVCKAQPRVNYTLAWYLVKRLGLSNDVCMCR